MPYEDERTELILNRDLLPGQVPKVRAQSLELPGGGHAASWNQIWKFALTFDAEKFEQATGSSLDAAALTERLRSRAVSGKSLDASFAEIRAALAWLCSINGGGASATREDAALIDAALDAIYAEVSGGKSRPREEPTPYEPGLGVFGAGLGGGQHRFGFVARDPLDRLALFDRVAGLLLREAPNTLIVSALYLCPPKYSPEKATPPVQVFMLLLESRSDRPDHEAIEAGYEHLTRLAVAELADPDFEHHPRLEDSQLSLQD